MKREDIYFKAMQARDHRFDGKFFVAVKTTGIYCRPICPAKPKRENVEFFQHPLEAEKAGYRPCLRCRPECAPLSPAWIGTSALVQRAVKMIHSQDAIEFNEDQFAARFGVSARHLRRLFVSEIGKTPKQISFENRLSLSRRLLTESRLPVSQVAYAAGFRSIRRFNDAFKDRFKRSPSQIRRQPIVADKGLCLTLPYRPPFNFEALLQTYRSHRVGELEWFTPGTMHRLIEFDGKVGVISISNDAENSRLLLQMDVPDHSKIHTIVNRVRALFDLDSDPLVIASSLEHDETMRALSKKHPGIRLPSGWDPFEIAVATILGQLVSVERGRRLVADLIEMLGEVSGFEREGRAVQLFPTPQAIARADLRALKTTAARQKTLREFAQAVADGRVSLDSAQDVPKFISSVQMLPGIGRWTASSMALKVLRSTDAFPETDLILARALSLEPRAQNSLEKMRPWRGYAAALLWRDTAVAGTKTKRSS